MSQKKGQSSKEIKHKSLQGPSHDQTTTLGQTAKVDLKTKSRNSNLPPGTSQGKEANSTIEKHEIIPAAKSQSSDSANQINKKRNSYLPPGYVLEKPKDLIVDTRSRSTSSSTDNAKVRKTKHYKPPGIHHRVDGTNTFSIDRYSKRKSFSTSPKRSSLNPYSTSPTTKTQDILQSNRDQKKSKGNSTLINLEAGLVVSRAKKGLDHTTVAKYMPDAPSYFIDAESYAYLRGFWMVITAGYLVWSIYYQRERYFISLVGWSWIGLFLYYSLTFSETLWYVGNNQQAMFRFDRQISEILFSTTTSLSFVVPVVYWIFQYNSLFRQLVNRNVPSPLGMIEIQELVGMHVPILMTIPEIYLSRKNIEKAYAMVPSLCFVLYLFLNWMLHYVFKWDFYIPTFFNNYFLIDMIAVHLFLVVLIATIIPAVFTIGIYMVILSREKIQKNKLKKAQKLESRQV